MSLCSHRTCAILPFSLCFVLHPELTFCFQSRSALQQSLAVHSTHFHFLSALFSIQSLLFLFSLRVARDISVPQLHAGYKHPSHSYLVGSRALALAANPRSALGFAVQFGLSHFTSRQLRHVLIEICKINVPQHVHTRYI